MSDNDPAAINPWHRYSASARVFITARTPEEAAELIALHEDPLAMLDMGTNDLCVYPEFDTPVFETSDAIIPGQIATAPAATPAPESDWTTQAFVSWGQYLIAALECDWDEDRDAAIEEFVARFGRRDETDDDAN